MIYKKNQKEINEEKFAKKLVKDNSPICEYYIMTKNEQRLDVTELSLELIAGYVVKHPQDGFEIFKYTSSDQRIRSYNDLKTLLDLKQKYNPGLIMDIIGQLGGNIYLDNARVIADYLKRTHGLNLTPENIITQMSDVELREKAKKEEGMTV